jgi:hypothetical protein
MSVVTTKFVTYGIGNLPRVRFRFLVFVRLLMRLRGHIMTYVISQFSYDNS